ncbi:MAG: hypothetical protein ACOX3A_01080 [bacterium]|jgi:hypothetical protein
MGEVIGQKHVRAKLRFDYRGVIKPSRFLFGAKNTERVAEETREQQIALLRNVPLQGLQIEDTNTSFEIYHIYDEELGTEIAFAPAEVIVRADSLEEILRFIMKEEFRKIEVLEPDEFNLSRYELERLLFKVNSETRNFIQYLQRRL